MQVVYYIYCFVAFFLLNIHLGDNSKSVCPL